MTKEDYFKYYIQGSDHYLIPKDIFDELFDEMESWKQDTNKYKEVIDKAIDLIEKSVTTDIGIDSNNIIHYHQLTEDETCELLEILKEVE